MSKKRSKRKVDSQVPAQKGQNFNVMLVSAVLIIILNILIINSVINNKFYNAFHTGLQLLAYLTVYNIGILLFYNFNYSVFSKRTKNLLYIILGISIFYVYIISFYGVLDFNGDNAGYLARAKSLIMGKGFRDIYRPGEPYSSALKSIGFSLLNIPFILIFGLNNYVGLKLLELISAFGALFFIFKYFEDKLEKDKLFLLVLTLSVFHQIIQFSSIIMTESVFLFLMFGIMYFTEKLLTKKKIYNKLKYYFYFFILACTLFFIYLTR